MARLGPAAQSGARRSANIVVASVLALGVAVVAILSTYDQFTAVSRMTQERREIAAEVQASLSSRRVTPAGASLETPVVALTRRPMDADALMQAGLSAAESGQAAKARLLIGVALHRDPRSVAARLWTLAAALRDNDPAAAVRQLDRLMIIARDDREAFFPVLAEVVKQPKAEQATTRMLAAKPEWRDGFLGYLASSGQDPALLFRLAASTPSGTEGVQAALIQKLIDAGQYDAAYLAWVNFLPESALGQVATVYDGGFSGLPGPRPFNWAFADSGAVSVGIAPQQGLQIDYPAARNVQVVSQTLVLKPGHYRMEFLARGAADTLDSGAISWRIACMADRSIVLDLPIKGLGDQPSRFAASFSVPANCQAQLLSLEGTAGTFPQNHSLSIRSVRVTAVGS